MSHVITQPCCNDASCIAACPVNCIHPTPDERDFTSAEMLYIDPATCIDCGACVPECPVEAIVPETDLAAEQSVFLDINAAYYRDHDVRDGLVPFRPRRDTQVREPIRVAVVGSGPAGLYTAEELLTEPNVHVDVLDRLPTPLGLIRFGVAPDHASTKLAGEALHEVTSSPRFRYLLGVEVGRDITAAELVEAYSAVVYAHGAAAPKSLGIDGEELRGSISSTEFVAWYNGHPDYADRTYDLSDERVVLVGNGNVALDVARILLADPEVLGRTDIADHALHVLRRSAVREVVLIGRRGPAEAAFTIGELAALAELDGVDVSVETGGRGGGVRTADALTTAKTDLLRDLAGRPAGSGARRLVFRFHTRPTAILGDEDGGVRGVQVVDGDSAATLSTSLVIRSIGYTGEPLDGLPFDDALGIVPNVGGRVLDPATDGPLAAHYVAGWIKRGPRGGIGTNRRCGQETARAVLDDAAAGTLTPRSADTDIADLATRRGATVLDGAAWGRIDAVERAAGREARRPRVKMTDLRTLITAAGLHFHTGSRYGDNEIRTTEVKK
ncbi:FAD-dependent oxidoreductase [Williamsia sterculiae]|uniref:ferredoxin--NADP(+) reductase n=1 Tax=Williamsia sterculiae TaxID=1344003 RepID=A0A1N7EX17_9NOCA|nr:FAD-dependent oxidoreductase [Williamsia sterculiae]SIR92653.1 ferredoxin--NADP+ reductase [Williamsia sterculiae]